MDEAVVPCPHVFTCGSHTSWRTTREIVCLRLLTGLSAESTARRGRECLLGGRSEVDRLIDITAFRPGNERAITWSYNDHCRACTTPNTRAGFIHFILNKLGAVPGLSH